MLLLGLHDAAKSHIVHNNGYKLIATCTEMINKCGGIILITGVVITLLNMVISFFNQLYNKEFPLLLSTSGRTKATLSKSRLQLG